MRIPLALAGLFLAASALFAQVPGANHFISSSGDVVLSAAATAVTLQQPAATALAGAKDVILEAATVYCSAACTVTHSKNGTAATATAGAPVAQPGNNQAGATATFWTASNAGSGTTLHIDHIAAGATATYTFSPDFRLQPFGTTSNYTIAIASMTGTVNIQISHAEGR